MIGLVLALSLSVPQLDIPEKRGVGFQTEQRIIRSLPSIALIVTNLSPFLMAEYSQHGAVEIEDETGAVLRHVDKLL